MTISNRKYYSLKNGMETSAMITDSFYMGKYSHYFQYVFNYNNSTFYGRGKYYPKSEQIESGDSIKIIFDSNNPKHNDTVRDFIKSESERSYYLPILLLIAIAGWWFVFKRKK
jgi:hypothetical protein